MKKKLYLTYRELWLTYNNASDENLEERIQNQIQDTVPTFQQGGGTVDSDLNDSGTNGTTESETITPGVNDGTTNDDATIEDEEATMPESDTNTVR